MRTCEIAPSILSADFARLGDEVRAVIEAGADLHPFRRDGQSLRSESDHRPAGVRCAEALCERSDRRAPDGHAGRSLVLAFAEAGASIISFHPEATDHVDRTIGLIHERGCKAGLVFNPATPLDWLDHVLDKLDLVLIMSVNPGFGGQSFIAEALHKLATRAQAHRCGVSAHGPRNPSRGRRRGQDRQHRCDRPGRRGHVRCWLGDLRQRPTTGRRSQPMRRGCRGPLMSPPGAGPCASVQTADS